MREKKGSVSLEGLVNWHSGCKAQCIYKVPKFHAGDSAQTGTRTGCSLQSPLTMDVQTLRRGTVTLLLFKAGEGDTCFGRQQ